MKLGLDSFSPKQMAVLTWWSDASPWRAREAIICDGAVRSGKTMCMSLSFVFWAMRRFSGQKFALCGRSVASVRRNITQTLKEQLLELDFVCREKISGNVITVEYAGRKNEFYLFGGKDEASQSVIQGITLAGVLLDEVALMPRSFVEQACARCSVEGSRMWFSCNPEGPGHWFYREWILKVEQRKALYLHFTMEDNPSLSKKMLERYRKMYTGVFYRRFILGQWVEAQGRVYDFFDESMVCPVPQGGMEEYAVSCDYGTANPASFGLWGRRNGVWYRIREYYYDSRREGSQKTDGEYVEEMKKLTEGKTISFVVVDPSAASFILALRRAGFNVVKAKNDVISGIRLTADMLKTGKLAICSPCTDAIREFSLYCWDKPDGRRDEPRKENDHAMDEIRYFAAAVADRTCMPAAALWVER